MQTFKSRNVLLLASFIVISVTAFALTPIPIQEKASAKREVPYANKQADDYVGPVVDYEANYKASTISDPKVQALRQVRSSRYSRRAPEPLGEFASVDFALHTDWEIGLQSLPVSQSDVVILGKVVEAQAYLSSDKMGVYSEFRIRIEKVLKNSKSPIKDFLIGEREGGVIRFSSGRLLPYKIYHQRLPRPQRNYIFFLRRNDQGEDYHIITGYEIRHGRISPLDELEKFAVFKDFDKAEFLNLLQETITNASQQKGKAN